MRVSLIGVLTGLALFAAPMAHAQYITGFEGYADGATVMFRQPSFSGSTGGLMAATPNTTVVSSEQAYSGEKSLKANWAWKDDAPTNWLRLTPYNTATLGNPTILLDQALTMKVFIEGQSPLGFALTVRETGTSAAVGANGGASGGIEFIGSSTGAPPTPTGDRVFAPGAWHTLSFVFPDEQIKAFAGATADGILTSGTMKGVIDSIAIRSMGAAGPYALYIDDIRVVSPRAIPEPGSMALLASGLLPLLAFRRRR